MQNLIFLSCVRADLASMTSYAEFVNPRKRTMGCDGLLSPSKSTRLPHVKCRSRHLIRDDIIIHLYKCFTLRATLETACNISSHTRPWLVATGFDPTKAVFAGSGNINKSVSFVM